jgi:hypothetical protein
LGGVSRAPWGWDRQHAASPGSDKRFRRRCHSRLRLEDEDLDQASSALLRERLRLPPRVLHCEVFPAYQRIAIVERPGDAHGDPTEPS